MEQLAGRVAVVTGAGRGIGRGIAAALAAEIMAAFDAQAPRYPGDEAIDTRAVMARPRTSAGGRS